MQDQTSRTVFVTGLPYEIEEEQIREFFGECGEIEHVNLPRYQDSNKNIGYSHVRFNDKKALAAALKLTGKYLGSRYVKIEMAKGARDSPVSIYQINNKKRLI